MEWRPKKWDGPLQFEDVETGELMMLPSDMALRTDEKFRVYAEMYAKDQELFFKDFSAAYAKLLSLGVPKPPIVGESDHEKASVDFLEAAMHGNVETVKKLSKIVDVHAVESSGRSALHKAAYWGHEPIVRFLLDQCKLDINARDFNGDTPLHDAVKYHNTHVVEILLAGKADVKVKNKEGKDPLALAVEFKHEKVVKLLQGSLKSKL